MNSMLSAPTVFKEFSMIRIINGARRQQFPADIDAMHRLRKRVFHDLLGWDVQVRDAWKSTTMTARTRSTSCPTVKPGRCAGLCGSFPRLVRTCSTTPSPNC